LVYQKPKRSPDYKETLGVLVNWHLAERGWSPARLAEESGLSKATISRITKYRTKNEDKAYRPQVNAIQTLALALQLNEEETLALFDAAYPGFLVWRECIRKGVDLDEANEILYEKGLPTFPIGYD
jgi:transcriptional regulator with XRE-family HTH domain